MLRLAAHRTFTAQSVTDILHPCHALQAERAMMLQDVGVDSSVYTTDPTVKTRFSTGMRSERIRPANPQPWPAAATPLGDGGGCQQAVPRSRSLQGDATADPAAATAEEQGGAPARGLLWLLQKRKLATTDPCSAADGTCHTDARDTATAAAATMDTPLALPTFVPRPGPPPPQQQQQQQHPRSQRRQVLHIIPSGHGNFNSIMTHHF